MKKAAVFFLLFPMIALFNLMPVLLQAQPVLERISVTERGDQKGLVVRHHLTAKVDSFKVVQPSEQLVQVMIYSRNLRTSGRSEEHTSELQSRGHLVCRLLL